MPTATSGVLAAAAHECTQGLLDGLLHVAAQVGASLSPRTAPQTPLGQALEALLVALRYAVFLVPALIVAAEGRRLVGQRDWRAAPPRGCPSCAATGHNPDAAFCRRCGDRLPRGGGAAPP